MLVEPAARMRREARRTPCGAAASPTRAAIAGESNGPKPLVAYGSPATVAAIGRGRFGDLMDDHIRRPPLDDRAEVTKARR
jgi:hypothetical protein